MLDAGKNSGWPVARAAVLCSLLALEAIAVPALAKRADRQLPILTFAKVTNVVDGPNSVTTLVGRVKVTQGSLVITGDLAKLYYDADQQLSRAVVTGHPAHIQELDEQGRLVQGDAEMLDYDNINQIAVLSKGAIVKVEGQGEVRGDKLTYIVDAREVRGESTGDGMVHGVILPRQKTGSDAAAQKQL